MANQLPRTLDATFASLATPTRRAILEQLRGGRMTATGLWEGSGVSKPAISKQLGVLEQSGLISREREGRTHWLSLRASPLASATSWLLAYERFWSDRLDSLEAYLRQDRDRASDQRG